MNKPLLSFGVVAFNQERYVRQAVAGALAQTYSPLEVILSDDCSFDSTFSLMQELAGRYHGPHEVVLNRNDRNLGLGGHVNRVTELARGELLLVAAGDDVSLPVRTQRIHEDYVSSGCRALVLFSDKVEIDEQGNTIRIMPTCPTPGFSDPVRMCRQMFAGVTGASSAWHRRLFEVFGPMMPEVTFEDRVIAFRAALLGGIRHIAEPLVRYRRHSANTVRMFHTEGLSGMETTLKCFLWVYRNNARDLETFVRKIQPDFPAQIPCRRIIQRRIQKLESYLQIHSGNPGEMAKGLVRLGLKGGNLLQGFSLLLRILRHR